LEGGPGVGRIEPGRKNRAAPAPVQAVPAGLVDAPEELVGKVKVASL